ncbi:glycosyltransferase family 4 protein [Aminobacterium colombiense]
MDGIPLIVQPEYLFLDSKKVVLLMHVDEALFTHRLPIARELKKNGAEVFVVAGDTGKGDSLESEGIHFIPIPLKRQNIQLFKEFPVVYSIFSILNKIKPDIVHNVSIKPVLYGSLISRMFNKWSCVNALSGLGYLFSMDTKALTVQNRIKFLLKFALQNPRSTTIVQNRSDLEVLLNLGLLRREQAVLIRGSGVNCANFKPTFFPKKPVVMLPARMLWDKGIGEFVRAAEMLYPKFPDVRFVLVGPADDDNPRSINFTKIIEWTTSRPNLEWWGAKEPHRMYEIISQATIIALPTYYPEGLPKSLLEGAACGKPLIASDIPACREIVREGINGILVPPKDAVALANAIAKILLNPILLEQFGQNGRKIACTEFAEEMIISQTLEVYREMLCFWQ